MATIADESDAVSFTAELQKAASEHTLTQSTPQILGNVFRGILGDTEAAKGRTARH